MPGLASTALALVAAVQVAISGGTRVWGSDQALEAASASAGDLNAGTPSGSPCVYGETASDPSSQYNGRVYDPGTGFHDYGARMYWPQIGRFISADSYQGDISKPASLNRYSYVLNNPYRYTDPTGHDPVQSRILENPVSYDYLSRSGLADRVSYGYILDHGFERDMAGSMAMSTDGGMTLPERNHWELDFAGIQVAELLATMGVAATIPESGAAPRQDSGGKGLANPFKGKSAGEIDEMFQRKGFDARGPDPVGGKGGYVDPKTGRSYHIDEANSFGESPHVDVNRPKDYKGSLGKKKYEMGGK